MLILVGDIGGTNARLALFEGELQVAAATRPSNSLPSMEEHVRVFLEEQKARPERACLAVAGPVEDDRCNVTNLPWVVDARELERVRGIPRVRVVNDFHAAAVGVLAAHASDLVRIGGTAEQRPRGPRVVLGAGTGLGVAFMVHDGRHHQALPGEGGHRDFAPRNEDEVRLWRFLRARHGRVSLERILSGAGLAAIYEFLADENPGAVQPSTTEMMRAEDPPAVVTRLGMAGSDPLCTRALDMFISALGAEAGNLGLQVQATGGVYVAGGIAPRLRERILAGGLRAAFDDKGRMAHVAQRLPLFLVVAGSPGLAGARLLAGWMDD